MKIPLRNLRKGTFLVKEENKAIVFLQLYSL